jgi:membrane-associated phospholipid phosphatase
LCFRRVSLPWPAAITQTARVTLPEHVRPGWALWGAALCFAAFVGLAVAVNAGLLAHLDQVSVDHGMIWMSRFPHHPRHGSLTDTAFPIFGRGEHPQHVAGAVATFVVTLPAAAAPATLLWAIAIVVLMRRGRWGAVAAWTAAWVVGNALELATKHAVGRGPLSYESGGAVIHISGLDASYPSGHAMRAVILAALVAFLWPRLLPLLAGWVVATSVMLVLGGVHVPTDVIGGLALGLSMALCATSISARAEEPRLRSASHGVGLRP